MNLQLNMQDFQIAVYNWVHHAFGQDIADNIKERNLRFIEESIELVQSLGLKREEVINMVDYVYNKPEGDPEQEIGGALICLAALGVVNNTNIAEAGEKELHRINGKVDEIREKQKNKPNSIKM